MLFHSPTPALGAVSRQRAKKAKGHWWSSLRSAGRVLLQICVTSYSGCARRRVSIMGYGPGLSGLFPDPQCHFPNSPIFIFISIRLPFNSFTSISVGVRQLLY